jgi:hypothetical protein
LGETIREFSNVGAQFAGTIDKEIEADARKERRG